jgi:hypothetical protein
MRESRLTEESPNQARRICNQSSNLSLREISEVSHKGEFVYARAVFGANGTSTIY